MRNPEKADTFLEIASSYGLLSKDELGRLTVGACDVAMVLFCRGSVEVHAAEPLLLALAADG